MITRGGSLVFGQMNTESCAFADLALHFYRASVILDNPIGNRKTESHSFAFFGREERLKDLR